MANPISPALDALAGELALGVLEGEARAVALRQVVQSQEFAASVIGWQQRLEPLFHAYAEVPPPDVWQAIEARLDVLIARRQVRQVRFWKGTSFLTGSLAASLAAVMILSPAEQRSTAVPQPAAAPAVFAQLAGGKDALIAAGLDTGKGQLKVRAVVLPASALVPELWVIPRDGVPRSLGLINPQGTSLVTLTPEQRQLVAEGAVLAISLELADGAPHDAPSSTPIATGTITSL